MRKTLDPTNDDRQPRPVVDPLLLIHDPVRKQQNKLDCEVRPRHCALPTSAVDIPCQAPALSSDNMQP